MSNTSPKTPNNKLAGEENPLLAAQPYVENFTRFVELSQRIAQELLTKQMEGYLSQKDNESFAVASQFFQQLLTQDPQKLWHYQIDYLTQGMKIWGNILGRFWGQKNQPLFTPNARDKRFKDSAWNDSFVFDFIKQSYLLTAQWSEKLVRAMEGVDPKTAQRFEFYTRQYLDAIAPTNFAMLNPEVLKTTIDSKGENLVRGMEKFLHDLEHSKEAFSITITDLQAFEPGKNLATTPGKVIFKNHLLELIHYTPTGKKTYETPLLIVPAWINKFYILDLSPHNSFVRFALEQGQSVFMVSWVNPDETLADTSFESYALDGLLAALTAVEKATQTKETNVVGYCLGGTLLTTTLAYLAATKQSHRIKSATLLTTLVDFSSPGELGVFVTEEQVSHLERRMREQGYLDGSEMNAVFSALRANDLIWSYVTNNYLLGRDPFPFDILYWNADSTRMPAAAHSFYLREMYIRNSLAKPGGIHLQNTPIDIRRIETPIYFLSTREDHIAPWTATYAATQLFKGPKTFVLSGSGHVAGVVNAPDKQKYQYWINPDLPASPTQWLNKAKETPGSWWPHWSEWLRNFGGAQIPALTPGDHGVRLLGNAPGDYVHVRSVAK